ELTVMMQYALPYRLKQDEKIWKEHFSTVANISVYDCISSLDRLIGPSYGKSIDTRHTENFLRWWRRELDETTDQDFKTSQIYLDKNIRVMLRRMHPKG